MTTYLPDVPQQAITNLIRSIRNFPIPRINVRDIPPILEQQPRLFRYLIDELVRPYEQRPPVVLVCIESFGYLFGAPTAYLLSAESYWRDEQASFPGPPSPKRMP